MAIADAVREVAKRDVADTDAIETESSQSSIGRRGHLRAIPS